MYVVSEKHHISKCTTMVRSEDCQAKGGTVSSVQIVQLHALF